MKGAVYSVYAGADIKAADGTLIYKKGALVKDNLVTGDDGSVTLKDLYLGTYTVTETKAPDNYVCKGESKTVELVYAGQTVEVQTGSATFLNERQKAAVRVEKQDEETKIHSPEVSTGCMQQKISKLMVRPLFPKEH